MTAVLRPTNGQPIDATAACAAGERVTGGGVQVAISDPRDERSYHMQQSGPVPGGWFARVEPTTTFKQGSTLTLTASALCIPGP